jgi:hypothetical protein
LASAAGKSDSAIAGKNIIIRNSIFDQPPISVNGVYLAIGTKSLSADNKDKPCRKQS